MKHSNAILQCCAIKIRITPDNNFALFPHPRSIKSKHVEVSCRRLNLRRATYFIQRKYRRISEFGNKVPNLKASDIKTSSVRTDT